MQIAVLGPLLVSVDGREVPVAGGRLRTLLTALAVAAPHPVGGDALATALWGDDLPADVANALQSLVSRLRRALGSAAAVRQSQTGYAVVVEPADVDLHAFTSLAAAARAALAAGDAAAADARASAALALWRGEPSADLLALAPHAEGARAAVRTDRARAWLRLGRAGDAAQELEQLVAAQPLREDLIELAVRALATDGRPAEALAAYERSRVTLADALGVDPSPALQAMHLELLRGEAGGSAGAPAPAQPTAPPRGRPGLPAALTSFLGREPQLARLADSFAAGRLVTLVGPGGAGKTRLAVEFGRSMAGRSEAGRSEADSSEADRSEAGPVWLAELAPVVHADDVAQAVLDGLGLRETTLPDRGTSGGARGAGLRDATDRLADALHDREGLLLLDNCEHVLDAAAELATSLLSRCADLRILATSREALGVLGEALVPVPPLDPEGAALQLFHDRAAAVDPAFAPGVPLAAEDAAAVLEIVRRLDGLPLALELAAAQLRTLGVRDVAARLSDRFRLLTGGNRAALPRHRTLAAVVAWSWELLTPGERLLAERLAVFSGSISVPAAAAMTGPDGPAGTDVEPLLAGLVDKSLLTRLPGPERRYRMLETIREYGADALAARDELRAARDSHARWCAALAREAEPLLRTSDQLHWIARLRAEQAELLTAVGHLAASGDAQGALSLVADLAWFWTITGRQGETVTWAGTALRAADLDAAAVEPSTRLTVEAHLAVSSLAWSSDGSDGSDNTDGGTITEHLARLRSVHERLCADTGGSVQLALLRPVIAIFAGDTARVGALFDEALASPDPWVRAAALSFRAGQAENDGDMEGMRRDATAAYEQLRALGERWGQADALQTLAQLDVVDGHLDAAEARYRTVLRLISELGAEQDEPRLRLGLAEVLMRQGRPADARSELTGVADGAPGSSLERIFTSIMQADILRAEGRLEEARPLLARLRARIEAWPEVFPLLGHGLTLVLAVAARIELADGDPAAAAGHLARAYAAGVDTRDMPLLANVGVVVATYAMEVGLPLDAAEMLGAAAAVRGADDVTGLEVAALSARLRDVPGTAAAYATGRARRREEAVARLDPATLAGRP